MKRMNEQEKRQVNGGSVAALIIAGLAIAAPYAGIAWDIGQGIGKAYVNRRRK